MYALFIKILDIIYRLYEFESWRNTRVEEVIRKLFFIAWRLTHILSVIHHQ